MPVSIIIPAYNSARFLPATLESVLAQTDKGWELIVVDDGSTDRTAQIANDCAARDERIRLTSQPNSGTASARNTGAAAMAKGSEFALFLDHDDVLKPDALECLLAALDKTPSAVAAHGLARKIDSEGKPLGEGDSAIQNFQRKKLVEGRVVNAARDEPTTAAMVVYDNLIPTPGVAIIRRSAINRLLESGRPLFDPVAAPLDDWDFWLRLTRLGDMAFLDRVVLEWRRHDQAGSQDTAAMSAAGLRIRERLVAENLPADLAEVASFRYHRLLATERRRAARKALGSGDFTGGLRQYMAYVGMNLRARARSR